MIFDSSAKPTDNERPLVSTLPRHARPWLRTFDAPPPVYFVTKPRMTKLVLPGVRVLPRGLHR